MLAEDSLVGVAAGSLGEAAIVTRMGQKLQAWSLGMLAEDSLGRVAACSLGEAAVVTRMRQKLGAWVW
jgi:hypothetical protein